MENQVCRICEKNDPRQQIEHDGPEDICFDCWDSPDTWEDKPWGIYREVEERIEEIKEAARAVKEIQ